MTRFGLTEKQDEIARRVIGEESARRDHLVVYLSGAHAYGFPSPDSDLDLKAVHFAKTRELLGFTSPKTTFDRTEMLEGVEIDYTSNEIGHVLAGILRGNGNFLERILGASILQGSPELHELQPIVRANVSRRMHRHYRGFAEGQLREVRASPTVKRLLYVMRTAHTGIRLLRSGELVTDVNELFAPNDPARDLIARKAAGEHTTLDATTLERFEPAIARLFAELDAAHDASALHEEPSRVRDLDDWLIRARLARIT